MKRSRRRWIVAGTVAVGALLLAAWGYHQLQLRHIHQQADVMPVPCHFISIPVREPSGVAYHARRNSLFVVSDQGMIVELDLQYRVLDRRKLAGDLEGIAVHPATGTLFIASEGDDAILEYDPTAHRVLRSLTIDFRAHPDFASGLHWNSGLEGVTVATGADQRYQLYAVVEARPARLIALSADVSPEATERARASVTGDRPTKEQVIPKEVVQIEASYDLGLVRMSDLMFHPPSGHFFIPSAGTCVLTIAKLPAKVIRSIRLPGLKPEGFCFVPNGNAIVVQDTGGLWECSGLRDVLVGPDADARTHKP